MTDQTTTVTTGSRTVMGAQELHRPGCAHTSRLVNTRDITIPVAEAWTPSPNFTAPEGSKDAYVVAYTRFAFHADAPEQGELAGVKIAPCLGKGKQNIG